jgi:hypothetical protein
MRTGAALPGSAVMSKVRRIVRSSIRAGKSTRSTSGALCTCKVGGRRWWSMKVPVRSSIGLAGVTAPAATMSNTEIPYRITAFERHAIGLVAT